MNHERMLKIADMIEEHPEHFNIKTFATVPALSDELGRTDGQMTARQTSLLLQADLFDCGTTACIAGWAVWLWAAEADPSRQIDDIAADILDLPNDVADDLFCTWSLTDAAKAAAHLREMVAKDLENSDA